MLVTVLASGSKGNSTLVQTDKLNILIDIGTNLKHITEKLDEVGLSPKDIDYIFLTHTHKDHVSALETFVKKYKPVVCMGKKMFMDLKYLDKYEDILILIDDFDIDDLHIEMIKTSHDVTESIGYIFTNNNKSLVYITDTGYINQKYFPKLKDKSMYILESNHDVEMLMHGKYPNWLKQRVFSDKGHLSNESSSLYLTKFIGNNTKYVVLAHLSQENNTEEIAYNTLKSYLKEYDIDFNNIFIAKQDVKSRTFEV